LLWSDGEATNVDNSEAAAEAAGDENPEDEAAVELAPSSSAGGTSIASACPGASSWAGSCLGTPITEHGAALRLSKTMCTCDEGRREGDETWGGDEKVIRGVLRVLESSESSNRLLVLLIIPGPLGTLSLGLPMLVTAIGVTIWEWRSSIMYNFGMPWNCSNSSSS